MILTNLGGHNLGHEFGQSVACKLTLSYGSILTNLGHKLVHEVGMPDVELGQSQYKPGHEFGQSAAELGQSQLDVEFGQSYVELGQSQSDVELILELELGQSDVELGQSQSDIELGRDFGRLNIELGQSNIKSTLTDEPSVNLTEPSAVDPPPDEPPDKPPDINLMSYFDPIPNVADYSSFCLDTNTYPTINLDNLGSGDTYEILRIDPSNNLSVTALFNLNAGPDAELYVGSTVTGVDDE